MTPADEGIAAAIAEDRMREKRRGYHKHKAKAARPCRYCDGLTLWRFWFGSEYMGHYCGAAHLQRHLIACRAVGVDIMANVPPIAEIVEQSHGIVCRA